MHGNISNALNPFLFSYLVTCQARVKYSLLNFSFASRFLTVFSPFRGQLLVLMTRGKTLLLHLKRHVQIYWQLDVIASACNLNMLSTETERMQCVQNQAGSLEGFRSASRLFCNTHHQPKYRAIQTFYLGGAVY